MGQIVGRVCELIRHEIFVRLLCNHPACHSDGSVRTFLGRSQYDLATERTDDLSSFHRHGLAHHYFNGIALDYADDGQSDACIAGCGLDDSLTRFESSVPFRLADHLYGNAVLDASAGVEAFQFREYVYIRIWIEGVYPDHRSISYRFKNVVLNVHLSFVCFKYPPVQPVYNLLAAMSL